MGCTTITLDVVLTDETKGVAIGVACVPIRGPAGITRPLANEDAFFLVSHGGLPCVAFRIQIHLGVAALVVTLLWQHDVPMGGTNETAPAVVSRRGTPVFV